MVEKAEEYLKNSLKNTLYQIDKCFLQILSILGVGCGVLGVVK
ncbi:MAG: hypothetical protein QNJ68_23880 [Microcoleaceae cyanobacterium MO_207.B10]|nr:hypothetical protein [Microcoleaceae cyanobacterium MO_207.B10]